MRKLNIEISSIPDREKLVAVIWYGNELIAEISQERGFLEDLVFANIKKVL